MQLRLVAFTAVALTSLSAMLSAQAASIPTSQAATFIGTWTFAMTNPPNTEHTVRIWDKTGTVAASLQVGKFPPTEITGVSKDGDMLVLTTTLRENGAPIWAVIMLTRDGETMKMAQMLQQSETIKRGVGRKQN